MQNQTMRNLKTMVLMQLKDKVDFSFFKSVKSTIFKVILSLIKFGVITAGIYLIFAVISLLQLVDVITGIPKNFFTLVFTIMMLLMIIVATAGLMKMLYYGKDNQLLLTFPVERPTVFTSKLIVYYIYELIRNLTYILPLLVAYGLIDKLPFVYYLWLIPVHFIITAISVLIGALLSIPAMFLTNFVSNNKWIQIPLLLISVTAVVVVLILLISAIPENFNLIASWGSTFWTVRKFIEDFVNIFVPFEIIVTMIIGNRYGLSNQFMIARQFTSLAIVLVSLVIVFVLIILLVRPLYFKMTSTPFEFTRKASKKTHKNKRRRTFISAVVKEILLTYRTSEKLFSLIVMVFGLPVSIYLLNKIYSAMNTRLTGTYLTIAFNVLLILLIVLSSNISVAHIYSEEGSSDYLMRTNPESHLKLLFSKLLLNLITVSVSLLITTIIFASFANYDIFNTIFMYLCFEFLYVSHLLWSAEMDIMNPQYAQYQSTGTHVNNPNEIKSAVMAFFIPILMTVIVYFFIQDNRYQLWPKMLIFAGLFMVIRIWLYVNKVKYYYKEKQ